MWDLFKASTPPLSGNHPLVRVLAEVSGVSGFDPPDHGKQKVIHARKLGRMIT